MKINHLRRVMLACHRLHAQGMHKQSGQALVELVLSLSLLAMLLGAAIDLGLAFKAHQTLTNATAEASTYLSLRPLDPSAAEADDKARERFRYEQGPELRGLASTLDLDADGEVDDNGITATGVQIDETDSDQIDTDSTDFSIGVGSILPVSSGSDCGQRRRFDSANRQCFIVVRATMVYKPFFIKPFVGSEMNITAISVKPIVGAPF